MARKRTFGYRRYRIQYVNARGYRDRPFTVNTHLLALRDFFGFLTGRGVVPAVLSQSLPYVREPKLLPKGALTHAEMMRILERVPGETPIHLRDRAVLEVLYSTGIRRLELVHLRLEHVDLGAGVLRIERGKGGKDRMVPLGRAAEEWVAKYLAAGRPALLARQDDRGLLFLSKSGGKLDGNTVREIVRRWARVAGMTKPVSPHTFRRSCATGMIRNRANPGHVKDILGHEDFRSLQAYVNLEIVDLKDAHRRFHPREQEDDRDGSLART